MDPTNREAYVQQGEVRLKMMMIKPILLISKFQGLEDNQLWSILQTKSKYHSI